MTPRKGGAMICMKRIYEPASAEDGYRVLVERLWPRGFSKAAARLEAWEKAIAPSDGLRRWYGHDSAKIPPMPGRTCMAGPRRARACCPTKRRGSKGCRGGS